ncbi:MAG: HlyC/CorC family transporter [Gammaproteobacteria bacterium]
MNAKPKRISWLDKISQVLHPDPKDKEELTVLLKETREKGIIDLNTLNMLLGILDVGTERVRDVMIPRNQMIVLHDDDSIATTLQAIIDSGHSRFPVISNSKDTVVGILLAKDLLPVLHAKESREILDLKQYLRPAFFVPESKRLDILLQEFRVNRNHLAIVVDEYGGVTGLITIEDVLEKIVGSIEDEYDNPEDPLIRELPDGSHVVKALTTIDELNETLKTQFSDEYADTVGGLVMREFGYLPKRGEVVVIKNFYFKILRADKRRIHLLQIIPHSLQ